MAEKAHVTGVENTALASQCMSAIAECNSLNSCFSAKGVIISNKCMEFMSKHMNALSCLSQGLGVARPKG